MPQFFSNINSALKHLKHLTAPILTGNAYFWFLSFSYSHIVFKFIISLHPSAQHTTLTRQRNPLELRTRTNTEEGKSEIKEGVTFTNQINIF